MGPIVLIARAAAKINVFIVLFSNSRLDQSRKASLEAPPGPFLSSIAWRLITFTINGWPKQKTPPLKTASACRRNCAITHFNWTSWFRKILPSLTKSGWLRLSVAITLALTHFHPTSHPQCPLLVANSRNSLNIQTSVPLVVCYSHCRQHNDGHVLMQNSYSYSYWYFFPLHIKGCSNFTLDTSHRTHSHSFHLGHVWEILQRLLGELENWQNSLLFFCCGRSWVLPPSLSPCFNFNSTVASMVKKKI